MLRVALSLAIVLAAAPALAGPPSPSPTAMPRAARLAYLRKAGAEGCPPEQVFRSSVLAQVDRDVLAPDAPARLSVTLARRLKDRLYEGTLEIDDASGAVLFQQTFSPLSRCSDVVQTIAVIVAETLDPVHVEPPEPAPPPAAPPPPSPVVAAPEADRPRPPSMPEGRRFHAGLASWLGLGVAPRAAVGLSGDVGIRWAPISVSAEVRWDPPAGVDLMGGARLTTSRLVGALVPCGHWSRPAWGLFGCGVAQVGAIWGTNESYPSAAGSSALYVAAGARLGAEVWLTSLSPRLGLRLSGDWMTRIVGGRFVVHDQVGWQMPRFSGDLGLGIVALW